MKPAYELPQFEFLGKLGTGGTAEVYKVLTKENKVAALKTILQSNNISHTEFQKLALREKTLLQNIDFPGIVKIFDVQTDDPCYICLEYCSGKTLEQYHKIDNIQTVLNILSSISVNLEFLNLKSIIHADLKPDNIFMPEDIGLFTSGSLTFTKLSDFSLGKFEHEDNSARAGAGTVGFMAPETINDNIVTHKSDLFALGVIAYQIITGQHPFITDDADPVKINSRILEEEPRSLLKYRDDISDELIQIVSALLEKDASNRPTSAWDVCTMLRDAGATYPFEKILNPKYTVNIDDEYERNIKQIANHHSRTDTISDKNNICLRLILTDNFSKENLYYKEKQFHFKSTPLTASYLIRYALTSFTKLSFTGKKTAIELSLQNETNNFISSILPHLLHHRTIKRIAKRLAYQAEHNENYTSAAHLYLLSGDLLKAENSAYQAAMQCKNENNIDDAVAILNKIISYGILLNRKFEIKSLYMVKGDLLKDSGEVDKAEAVYNELIELYKDHSEDELLAETYKDLGDLFKMKRKPDEGIKSLEKALDIFKKLKHELEISKTYNNLGNIYTIENNHTTALSYFRKALRIQKKLSAAEEVASTLNNIGAIFAMTSKFHRSLKIFKISLSIKKGIGNKGEIARVLNNIGFCYEMLGETQKAVEMLQESLRYNKEIDSKREILFNLENLTTIMFATGQLKESIAYLREGITLATELHDQPHLGFFNLYMGSVLVRMGKLKEANICFESVELILNEIEDDALLVLLNTEKAQLAFLIDNKQRATALLDDAYSLSDTVMNKAILIKVLLLKLAVSSDTDLLMETKEKINELGLTKEKTLFYSYQLTHYLHNDDSYDVQLAYEQLTETVQNSNEHIEQCQLLITLAKYELKNNNLAQAVHLINQSIQLSKSRGLLFDRFHALVLFGDVLSRQKEYEQCYSIYKQALEIAKDIFNQLETDEDKQAFQNKEQFIFLVSEIKKLSKIIGQKKEQMS